MTMIDPNDIVVRPMLASEATSVVDYFLSQSPSDNTRMGVRPDRLPTKKEWNDRLHQILIGEEAKSFYVTWIVCGQPIGHSNINDIEHGVIAAMHLHLWQVKSRQSGIGSICVQRSIKIFFDHFSLDRLICQPHAINLAPNRTLARIGFRFIKNFETTPGPISFPQRVNRWELSRAEYDALSWSDR